MNERRNQERVDQAIRGAEQAARRFHGLDDGKARQVGVYCLNLITRGATLRRAWRRARLYARVLAGKATWAHGLHGRAAG